MLADPATALLWLVAAVYTALALSNLRDVLALGPLPRLGTARGSRPSVTVVIAARDEQARIGRTLGKLLEQRDIELEIVVVDDRSSDETPAILGELARNEPRLRALRVEQLPAGWLGKNHACHIGARAAKGEWLLFTDGDAWMQDDVIARAIAAAQEQQVQHVCLVPSEAKMTWLARSALLQFWTGMLVAAARANRDRRFAPIGIGAFNLVRSDAYRALGGHEPLRLEVIDDMKLGVLLHRAGHRSRVYLAVRELEVTWAGSIGGILQALEKNLFAMFGFSFFAALVAVLGLTVPVLLGLAGPLSGTRAGLAAFAALFGSSLPALIVAARYRWGLIPALLSPLMNVVFAAALVRSAWTAWRRGGVEWRGTLYPLDELRRGRVPLFRRMPRESAAPR